MGHVAARRQKLASKSSYRGRKGRVGGKERVEERVGRRERKGEAGADGSWPLSTPPDMRGPRWRGWKD